MRIISYQFEGLAKSNWIFSKVELGKLNLLVGDSGTGKTRFLNTIFNLGRMAVSSKVQKNGFWKLELEQDGSIYEWELEVEQTSSKESLVKQEHLWQKSEHGKSPIVERTESVFKFSGKALPKLPRESTSLSLLKEEENIKPLYEGFKTILKRDFSADELRENTKYDIIAPELLGEEIKDLPQLFLTDSGVNLKLYWLSENLPGVFQKICDQYMEVFPFIRQIKIRELKSVQSNIRFPGIVPVFSIKERYVDDWIPVDGLSSGMQKVLLILTDVYTLPDGGIYLIDEYENSLGINAINFLPTFLNQIETEIQFIITSHHPYIINKIPPENWLIFHRKGSEVKIRYGEKNVERFSRSKQQRFIQLLNDPFYNEGIE